MAIYRDKIIGHLEINESSSIQGQVIGNVIVKKNVNLQLHGMIQGNLFLEPLSETFIHGVLKGDIENEGSLYVFGTIDGSITTRGSGKTKIDTKANIVKAK